MRKAGTWEKLLLPRLERCTNKNLNLLQHKFPSRNCPGNQCWERKTLNCNWWVVGGSLQTYWGAKNSRGTQTERGAQYCQICSYELNQFLSFFFFYMCSPFRSPLPPPSPPAPSRSSQCTRSEHLSHASNLGWWSVSPLIVYMFQCCSLETSRPRLLP